jgi:hypothetical protein
MLVLPGFMRSGFTLGAQQVALKLVNTSVGLKPTSTKNKDALITDPSLAIPALSAVGGVPADYIPVEGQLNNHFNPSYFQLDTDPATGTFGLGSTAMGVLPFQVLGFEAQTVDGGLIDVQDNGTGGSTVTDITNANQPEGTTAPNGDPLGPVGGGETGNVFDIHFKIINDEQSLALSSDQDQDFYQLFLTQTGDNAPSDETTFVTPDSYVTFSPIDSSTVVPLGLQSFTVQNGVDGGVINGSVVPEVSSAGFLAVGGLTLFLRRRRAKKQTKVAASVDSSTPPDHA